MKHVVRKYSSIWCKRLMFPLLYGVHLAAKYSVHGPSHGYMAHKATYWAATWSTRSRTKWLHDPQGHTPNGSMAHKATHRTVPWPTKPRTGRLHGPQGHAPNGNMTHKAMHYTAAS